MKVLEDLGITRQVVYQKANGFYLLMGIEQKDEKIVFHLTHKKDPADLFTIEIDKARKVHWIFLNYGKKKKQLRIGSFARFVGNGEDLLILKKEIEEHLSLQEELA